MPKILLVPFFSGHGVDTLLKDALKECWSANLCQAAILNLNHVTW